MSSKNDFGVFLPTSRNFPTDDPEQLKIELNKAYNDTAIQVNQRETGIYSESIVQTGGTWYVSNTKNQTLRKNLCFYSLLIHLN